MPQSETAGSNLDHFNIPTDTFAGFFINPRHYLEISQDAVLEDFTLLIHLRSYFHLTTIPNVSAVPVWPTGRQLNFTGKICREGAMMSRLTGCYWRTYAGIVHIYFSKFWAGLRHNGATGRLRIWRRLNGHSSYFFGLGQGCRVFIMAHAQTAD